MKVDEVHKDEKSDPSGIIEDEDHSDTGIYWYLLIVIK